MTAYGLVGKFATAPENRSQLLGILSQAADLMQDADGCHLYVVSKDANDDSLIWVMELWDSSEAHDQSLTLPGVRELINQAMPLLTAPPDTATLIPISGKGM